MRRKNRSHSTRKTIRAKSLYRTRYQAGCRSPVVPHRQSTSANAPEETPTATLSFLQWRSPFLLQVYDFGWGVDVFVNSFPVLNLSSPPHLNWYSASATTRTEGTHSSIASPTSVLILFSQMVSPWWFEWFFYWKISQIINALHYKHTKALRLNSIYFNKLYCSVGSKFMGVFVFADVSLSSGTLASTLLILST